MKIAQIVCSFPPYKGGIGDVAWHFSWKLSALGHEITVFTPEYDLNSEDFDEQYPFKIKRLKSWLSYGKAAFPKGLYKELKKFDWVHLHTPFFGTAEIIWWKMLFNNHPKLAITYHMEFIPHTLFQKTAALPSALIQSSLYKQAKFITVSSFDYLQNSADSNLYTKFKNKIYQLPFGAEEKFSQTNKPLDLIEKYNISSKTKVVLFVGGLDKAHYFKGVEILLKAFAHLNTKAKLIIVGKGELTEKYKKLAQELKIADKVIFTGFVENEILNKYYNLSDICVLPSINRGEAFGIVLVNAMKTGKPVIASDLPGVRQVVDPEKNGILVEPGNVSKLSKAMDRILSQPAVANRMGKYGLKKANTVYQWDKIITKLDFIYKKYENRSDH